MRLNIVVATQPAEINPSKRCGKPNRSHTSIHLYRFIYKVVVNSNIHKSASVICHIKLTFKNINPQPSSTGDKEFIYLSCKIWPS